MTIYFYKTGEMNGPRDVKNSWRSSAILNFENDDKYCFVRSILAHLHPCKIIHLNRVSNHRLYCKELNIQGFDFLNGFKCGDVHKYEKLNKLSINIFEINFYQEQNKWKHKCFEISKNQ